MQEAETVEVVSHRGRMPGRAENTLDAFAAAFAAGAEGVETDLRLDRAGEIVLVHDRLLPDGRPVSRCTRQELTAALGDPVPLLEDALAAFPDRTWNLEVKEREAVGPLLALLRRAPEVRRVVVSSFWHDAMARLAGAEPALEVGVLVGHRPVGFPFGRLARRGIRTVIWNHEFADARLVERARRAGLSSWTWGPGNEEDHRRCLAWGLGAVITDHLHLALRVRAGEAPAPP